MIPFFFGTGGKRLFGVFHPPVGTSKKLGVVLCQPLHREYLLAHRAMRVLASSLAKSGHPVLRFDYYGCGDSAGDGGETRLDRCCEDIKAAVSELQDMGGVRNVGLVGLRLGEAWLRSSQVKSKA